MTQQHLTVSETFTTEEKSKLSGIEDGATAGGDVAGTTHAAAAKATPVDADEFPLVDTENGNVIKKWTLANLKTVLASWLSTLTATWSNKTLTAPVLSGASIVPTGGTVALHNQADQTTNYERGRLVWNTNRLDIVSEAGGTGTFRDIRVGVGNSTITASAGAVNKVDIAAASSTAGIVAARLAPVLGAASGTQTGLKVAPTLSQTSTAGYTAVEIDATETTTGSGTKRLVDAKVGGVSKFSVDNAGKVTATGFATVAAPTGVAATDTAAIQAAHDALPSTGGDILLQAGQYELTAAGVTFTKRVRLSGVGAWGGFTAPSSATCLHANATNATAITVTSEGFAAQDFRLYNESSVTPVSGYGIQFTGPAVALATPTLSRVFVANFYDDIRFVDNCYQWRIDDCQIEAPVRYGVFTANPSGDDTGDNVISRTVIAPWGTARTTATAAVRWESGGGFRFVDSKINGATAMFATGLDIAPADGVTTSDIFVQNNSIENVSGTAVKCVRAGTTGVVRLVQIQGNQFQGDTDIEIEWGPGFSAGMISGNVADGNSTDTKGVVLRNGCGSCIVGENFWHTGIITPITVEAGSSADAYVGPQYSPEQSWHTRLESPPIFNPRLNGNLLDSNGRNLIASDAWDALAVNHIGVETSPAANNYVKIAAKGGDADVVLELASLGVSPVRVNQVPVGAATVSAASASSLTPNVGTANLYAYTGLAANLTVNAPSGTPKDGQPLDFRIRDNGTSRTLTFNAVFRALGTTIPAATTINKTLYLRTRYNSAESVYDVYDVKVQA